MPFDAGPGDWGDDPEPGSQPDRQRFGMQIFLTICGFIMLLPFALMFVAPAWPL